MPLAPPRACPRPGCPNVQPCADHRHGETHAEESAARPWSRLYDSARWRRLSARVRSRQPVCESCKAAGHTPRPTRVTDHVIPHRGDLQLFYAESNLRAMCAECHNEKSRREQLS